MLQQCHGGSFGEPMASLGRGLERSPVLRLGRTSSHGHNLNLFGNFSSPKERKTAPIRGGSLDLPSKQTSDTIVVNVSGKVFEFFRQDLEVYPQSLLAKQSKAGKYYDFDRKDYFFDRSRVAFESIYSFYKLQGALVFPENFPEQLMMDEFYFFGLYDYLDTREKKVLVKPSQLANKVTILPKYDWQLFLWHLLENPDSNLGSKIFSIITLILIAFSIIIMCLDTIPTISSQQRPLFSREKLNNSSISASQNTMRYELFAMETFCILYFTIEITLRFIVSPIKLRFWFRALNIIDLIAILPYYLIVALEESYSSTAITALRMFRLFRAFRILKVSRYVSGMQVLGQTLREALSDLWMIAFLTVIGTLLFASCVFYFENIWNPGTSFESIPLSLWWSVVTISTIGYGDMAPKTLAGKLVGSMCAISGVLLIAPLLPIVYERWQRYYQLDQDGKKIKAGQKLLREIEKRRRLKAAKNEDKEQKLEQRGEISSKNGDMKDNEDKRRMSKEQENKEVETLQEHEVKPGDDVVWTHIKRASLKRKESSQSLLKVESKSPSQKGAKRESSRKGKDCKKRSSEASPALVEDETPIFTFTDVKGVERPWEQPGPSNIVY